MIDLDQWVTSKISELVEEGRCGRHVPNVATNVTIGIFRVDIPWVDIKMPDAASVGDFIAYNGSYKIGES